MARKRTGGVEPKSKPVDGPVSAPASSEPVATSPVRPNLVVVAQAGRLEYEALIFLASLQQSSPDWVEKLFIVEPQPSGAWSGHETLIAPETRELLLDMGAKILPFEAKHFGASYPYGNKIEALAVLPEGQPFLFMDTDTLITGALGDLAIDFDRPAASMRREGTWPQPPLYGPGYGDIWGALYKRFGLDFASSLDLSQPDEHWERYLYFNAGWFFGADPVSFGQRMTEWAVALRDDPGDELACQSLDPWLDQIVLPLVIHSFGGGRPGTELAGLDGGITCHYRNLPLLYAREGDRVVETLELATAPNKVKKRLREWMPARKLIYQEKGRTKVRPLFDQADLPRKEQPIRNHLKRRNWWLV